MADAAVNLRDGSPAFPTGCDSTGDSPLQSIGIARTIERSSCGLSQKVTYNCMAPEVYQGNEYGFSVDLILWVSRYIDDSIKINSHFCRWRKRLSSATRRRLWSGEYQASRWAHLSVPVSTGEIIRKSCAFETKERHSTPVQMRQELEVILYDQ